MLIFSRRRWGNKKLGLAQAALTTAMILSVGVLPTANAQTTQEARLAHPVVRTAAVGRTNQTVIPLPAQRGRTDTSLAKLRVASLSKLPNFPDLSLEIELEIPDFSPEAHIKATVNMEKNLLGSLAQTFGGVDCNLLKKSLGLGEMGQLLKVEDNSTSSKLSCSLSSDAPFDLINDKFNDLLSLDKSNQTLKVKLGAIGDGNVAFPPNKDMFTLQVTVPGKVDKAPRIGKQSGNTFTFNASDLAELSELDSSEATIESSQTALGSVTGGNGLLVGLLLVVLIGGAIGGGYFYYRKQQANKQSVPPMPMVMPGNGLNPGFPNQRPGFPNQVPGVANPNQVSGTQNQPPSFPNQSQGVLNQSHGLPHQFHSFQNQSSLGLTNQQPGFSQQPGIATPNPGFTNPEFAGPNSDPRLSNPGVNNANCPPKFPGSPTTSESYPSRPNSGNPILGGSKNDNPTAILPGLNGQSVAGQPTEVISANPISGFNPGSAESGNLTGFTQPAMSIPPTPTVPENQVNQGVQPGFSQPSVGNGEPDNPQSVVAPTRFYPPQQ